MSITETVAILVGGKGTRLQTVVKDVPKPLAPVANEPFLFLLIRDLVKAGVKKIVLLTGYMHEKIVEACGDGSAFGVEIVYSREIEPLGTAGALRNAKQFLQSCDDFILMNGDTYFDCSLTNILQEKLDTATVGMLALGTPEEFQRFGSVQWNPQTQLIEGFLEKSAQSTGYVSAGIYKFSSRIFDFIPAQGMCSIETEIFPVLVKHSQLKGMLLSGAFYDIGLPESYADFCSAFA